MSKVTIGITTYGPHPRAQNLARTIFATAGNDISYNVAIADDSRGGGFNINDRRAFCKENNISLLEGDTISGIPASWNRLIAFAKESESSIVVIFSDGVRLQMPGWLPRIVYYLENNEMVGTVGIPTVDIEDFNYNPLASRWYGQPARVGCAVGCSFAFKTDVSDLIHNADGTVGFWEDLVSFHEEIDFGFSLAEKGYLSVMLPWPPSRYRGGMAFGAHEELTWRSPSPYLPMVDFLKYSRMSQWHVPSFEERYENGIVDKMSYSRMMAAKKWGVLDEVEAGRRHQKIKGEIEDVLEEPQKFRHPSCVDIWPPREVVYLDKEGKEQKATI